MPSIFKPHVRVFLLIPKIKRHEITHPCAGKLDGMNGISATVYLSTTCKRAHERHFYGINGISYLFSRLSEFNSTFSKPFALGCLFWHLVCLDKCTLMLRPTDDVMRILAHSHALHAAHKR